MVYYDNPRLEKDCNRVMSYKPKRFLYAHVNEKVMM